MITKEQYIDDLRTQLEYVTEPEDYDDIMDAIGYLIDGALEPDNGY